MFQVRMWIVNREIMTAENQFIVDSILEIPIKAHLKFQTNHSAFKCEQNAQQLIEN